MEMKQWKRLLATIALCIGFMMSSSPAFAADAWTGTVVDPEQEKEQAIVVEERNDEIVEHEWTSIASEPSRNEQTDYSKLGEGELERVEEPVSSSSDQSVEEVALPASCDTHSMTVVESNGIPYDRTSVEMTFVGTATDGSAATYSFSLPNEGDGTYRWSKESLPAGTYEVKVDGRSLWARSIVLTYFGNCSTIAQLRPIEDGFGNEVDHTQEGDDPSVVENGEDVVVNDPPSTIVDRPDEGRDDSDESVVSNPGDSSIVERPTVQDPVVVPPVSKMKRAARSSSSELQELPQTGEGTYWLFIALGSLIVFVGIRLTMKRLPHRL